MFVVEGGWGMYPVTVFGLCALALAVKHVVRPKPGDLPLLVGVGIATLLLGVLGTVTGLQASARAIERTPEKWIFLVGLAESLNVLVTALVLTTLQTLVATYGARLTYARARSRPLGSAS